MADTTTAKIFDYPRNAWYVAAWDYEVTRKPLARTIAGRPQGVPVRLAGARRGRRIDGRDRARAVVRELTGRSSPDVR